MSRRLIVRAEAEFDITEAAVWYEGREPGLGLQVTAEIRAAVDSSREFARLLLDLVFKH